MKNFNTFVVLSTINTSSRVFDTTTRFDETIETLNSIHKKIPNVKILFIDNSLVPPSEEQRSIILDKVDVYHQLEHNLYTRFINGVKGYGEAYMMDKAMYLLKEHDLIGKRVFKLSGRYRLADSFDINYYDDAALYGKYTFKINLWDTSADNWRTKELVVYFETRLWSFCSSLFDEYQAMIQTIFEVMMTKMPNWEKAHWYCIPHDKVHELKIAHVEGYTADTGIYKFE